MRCRDQESKAYLCIVLHLMAVSRRNKVEGAIINESKKSSRKINQQQIRTEPAF